MPKTGEQAAALYVYSAYSPFEDVVNTYMTQGYPLVPPVTQNDYIGLLSNYTYTSSYINTSAFHAVPPVAPQDIKILD